MTQPTSYTWGVVNIPTPVTISSVRGLDANTLEIVFSADMVSAEAMDPARYSITSGISVLSVTNVAGNLRVYRIKTSDQGVAASYTVTATNIHDLLGNST